MKRNGINIFATLILFVFIGTIIYFASSIKNEMKASEERTKDLFNKISYSAENNLDSLARLDFSVNAAEIQSVSIRHNNEVVVCYPNEEIAENSKSTNLVKVFNKTIVKEEDVYSIKASLYLLRPAVIYQTTKTSFIVVLIATIITTITLIYVSTTEKNTAVEPSDSENEQNDSSVSEDEPLLDNSEVIEEETSEEPEMSYEPEEPILSNEEIAETPDEGTSEEDAEIEAESSEENIETDNIDSEESPYYQGIDETVEIPETRTEFIEKLNDSLAKASENEQDLSIFLIEFSNGSKEDKVMEILNNNFHESNTAKYGKNVFAAFKPEANIDEAEDFATAIQAQLAVQSEDNNCFVGISSKSIRMLGADRLLMEAEEALCHAKEDPDSPIIGFHVDIEKYREFIKNS